MTFVHNADDRPLIGLLAPSDSEFANAVIRRLNQEYGHRLRAEFCRIPVLAPDTRIPSRIILDRMSHVLPYGRAWLKLAAAAGCLVVSNPFQVVADDKFWNFAIAHRLGIPFPRTRMIPPRRFPPEWLPE